MEHTTQNHDRIEVADTPSTAYVRIHGRATFKTAPDFRDFALHEVELRRHGILVDLGDCESLDSTFVGVLTSLTLRMKRTGAGVLKLFNMNDHLFEILRTLGLLSVLDVASGPLIPSAAYSQLVTGQHDKVDIAHLMLDAHETLASLSDRNAVQFKDVVIYLRDRLQSE